MLRRKKTTTTTTTTINNNPTTRGTFMGINAGAYTNLQTLDATQQLGLRYIRVSHEMGWTTGAGSLDALNQTVQAATQRNLVVIQAIQKAGHTYSLNDLPALKTFATQCAATGAIIELGNEQNNIPAFFNDPTMPPNLAAQINSEMATAIRQTHPNTIIITQGCSPAPMPYSPHNYWPQFWDTNSSNHQAARYDAPAAIHPYCYPEDPTSLMDHPEWNPWAAVPLLRNAMTARGLEPTIWFTEVGCPGFATNAPTIRNIQLTEQLQASNTTSYLNQWWKLRRPTEPIIIATMFDGASATTSIEKGLGLIRTDGTKKPAWTVVRDFAALPA